MPNGHGGTPWLGAPIIAAILAGLFIWGESATTSEVPHVLAYLFAVIAGWRLAFHLTMWDASEYDGAYTPREDMKKARRKYLLALVVLVPLAVTLVYVLMR